MIAKFYITNGGNSKRRDESKRVTKTICQSNKVITYFRCISIPGQVRVGLVIKIDSVA